MSQLLARIFGLFAFKSTRLMLLVFACAFIVLFLALPLLSPLVQSLSTRSRLATLQKLASVDRSALKDEKLRQGYDRLLADFEKGTRSLTASPSTAAVTKATAKPSPKPTPKPSPKPSPKASAKPGAKPAPTKAPAPPREASAFTKGFRAFLGRLFSAPSIAPFLSAAALWLILGLAALLARDASGGARFLAFLLLFAIGLASGTLAVFFIPTRPAILVMAGIVFAEFVTVSALGTLGKELEGGR